MRPFVPLTLVAALAVAVSACNSSSNDNVTPSATEEATASATGTEAATAGAMSAQQFADAVAASDMFEIESSKIALERAENQAIKDFARMMVDDHTKSSAALKEAAGVASPAVAVAPKLTAQQQTDLDALKNAKANFDALYALKQSAAHAAALAMLQQYAASGDSAPLKAFAAKTAPVVSEHLEKARGLTKSPEGAL